MPAASPGILSLGAAVAALYFAVHPLRVESVAWITERRDSHVGAVLPPAILAYLKACTSGRTAPVADRTRAWVSLGATLALASKSIVMGLPAGPARLSTSTRSAARPSHPGLVRAPRPGGSGASRCACSARWRRRRVPGMRGHLRTSPTDPGSPPRHGRVQRLVLRLEGLAGPLDLGPIYELPARVNPLDLPYLLSAAGALAITARSGSCGDAGRRASPSGCSTW